MLKAGDIVEVRSEAEILATLDDQGRLEGLPFMPEMLKYCGKRFGIYKRADKTCDTATAEQPTRLRSVRNLNTVHLEGLRCDGQAHGGCQALCLLFWKEAWLKEVDTAGEETDIPPDGSRRPSQVQPASAAPSSGREKLFAHTSEERSGERVYMCQATALPEATSPLRWWNVRQYARDLTSRNIGFGSLAHGLAVIIFNKFQSASKRVLPESRLIRGGQHYPFTQGQLERTPRDVLNLQPGEVVEIKSLDEIVATLDQESRNRGLSFDAEMVKYTGRRARVLKRVDKIIDEKTGKMLTIKGDCLMLEGVICCGDYNRFCQRSIYPYWREIWLKRVAA